MEALLLHPAPPPPELAQAIDLAGLPWKAVADEHEARRQQPDTGWGAGIVVVDLDPDSAFSFCRAIRKLDNPVQPVLLMVSGGRLTELEHRDDLFEDFCLWPFQPRELEVRLRRLIGGAGGHSHPDLVEYGPLVLNLENYQALLDGQALDLTYMEYELLKFLAQSPGRVFTRETLLSRVWGYEYYGGARTVDVHIRRLRAKLGEEHAGLISTVRSVGYRFGQSRWDR